MSAVVGCQRGLSTIRLTLFISYLSLKLTWSWWISGMIFIQWHFTVIQCVLVLCRCRSSMRFFSTLATLVPTSWTSSDRNSSLKSRALVLASKSKGFLLSLSLSQRSFFNFGGLIFSFVANFLVENFYFFLLLSLSGAYSFSKSEMWFYVCTELCNCDILDSNREKHAFTQP